MAEVLSQSEIESLLASMTGADEAPPTSPATQERRATLDAVAATAPQTRPVTGRVFLPLHKRRRAEAARILEASQHRAAPASTYEVYDFRRPDKLSKDHLRSLQMLHENFAGLLLTSLAGHLRTQVEVDLVSVEQVPYDEYLKTVSASLLNILNVDALTGQAIFEIDFAILFSMLDRLLGGKGAAGKVVRDLTDIEKTLGGHIVDMALADLKSAWDAVLPVDFDLVSMETSPQFVQIVPGNDTVVLILFEIRIGEFSGSMSLCVPYLLLKPILGKLSTQRWLASDRKKHTVSHGSDLARRLHTTKVDCIARLGVAALNVADLANLEVGQVVPMQVCPPPDGEPAPKARLGAVDLVVGDQVKFRGRTGLRGRKLAVQVEQIVAAPTELITHFE